jgi:putative Mg2+ transporter-C (MgtC) family protein
MEWFGDGLAWLQDLGLQHGESMLRLCLAASLGALIGLERETSGKPAGFRTNLLICLGAALITELSYAVALEPGSTTAFRSDPGRIAAQIVTGVGFLGAGTIMQARGAVTGLTTAATLWVVAAIGMAVGAGAYVTALLTTGIVVFALFLLFRVEEQLITRRPANRTVEVVLDPARGSFARLEERIGAGKLQVLSVSVRRSDGNRTAAFRTRGAGEHYPGLVEDLLQQPGVLKVSLL